MNKLDTDEGYRCLQLSSNPFIPVPPITAYETSFRSLFSARSAEVEQVCRCARSAMATFVVAPYGGGKTVVVLEALSRLKEAGVQTVYAPFERAKGFRQSLIDALSSAGLDVNNGGSDSMTQIQGAIRPLRRRRTMLTLAIDDLDRATDITEVFDVTHDVRDLLGEGVAVVVTGQPFGVTFDLHTSAGGLFHEIDIPAFSRADFREMLGRYLRSVHLLPSLPVTHPFDESSADFICRAMSDAKLTPRLFNFAVSELLLLAASRGLQEMPIKVVMEDWPAVAKRVVEGLTQLQVRHLETIFKEAVVSEDTPGAIERLGRSKLAEFHEVQDTILLPLVEKNLVYVRKEGGKDQYRLTPHGASAVADLVLRPLGFEQRRVLTNLWTQCQAATDSHEKGKLLEEFVASFLRSIPGFHVPRDNVRLRTESEELDVVVEVIGYEHHVRYGVLILCECKNWLKAVPGEMLAHLRDKLRERSCRFGVFVAVNGVLPGFRNKMKAYLLDGIVIALLTGDEFARLAAGESPETILRDAYYMTTKYMGEAQ